MVGLVDVHWGRTDWILTHGHIVLNKRTNQSKGHCRSNRAVRFDYLWAFYRNNFSICLVRLFANCRAFSRAALAFYSSESRTPIGETNQQRLLVEHGAAQETTRLSHYGASCTGPEWCCVCRLTTPSRPHWTRSRNIWTEPV